MRGALEIDRITMWYGIATFRAEREKLVEFHATVEESGDRPGPCGRGEATMNGKRCHKVSVNAESLDPLGYGLPDMKTRESGRRTALSGAVYARFRCGEPRV